MNDRLTALSLMMILISLTVPAFATGQTTDSPISEGPIWTKQYDDNETVFSYPTSDGDFFIMHGEKIDLVDGNGKKIWTQDLSNTPMMTPAVKDGKMYILSRSDGGDRTYLNCLYMDNGTKIWDMEVDHWGFHTVVNDEGEICIPGMWGGNITKISPDQEIVWDKDLTDGGHIRNMFLMDGRLYVSSGYDEHKALCVSADGEVEWEFTGENGYVSVLRRDRDSEKLFAETKTDIYEVDKDGNGDKIYQVEDGTSLNSVMYHDGNYYLRSQEDEGNGTYLKAVSEDGEILWNNTLEPREDGYDHLQTRLTMNDRIYCEYRNRSDEYLKTDRVKVYDLNGELAWEHEYGNDTQRQYHFVNEDGIIVTWNRDGEVFAYQGRSLNDDDETGYLRYLVLFIGIVLILAVAMVYRKHKKNKHRSGK